MSDEELPVVVSASPFGHCGTGHHDQCIREHQPWYFEGKKVVYRDYISKCGCTKRGCKCYTKRADRPKRRRKRPVQTVKVKKAL